MGFNYSRFRKDNYKRDNHRINCSNIEYQKPIGRNNLTHEQKTLISNMYFSDIYKTLDKFSSEFVRTCLGKKYLSVKQKNVLNDIYVKYYSL